MKCALFAILLDSTFLISFVSLYSIDFFDNKEYRKHCRQILTVALFDNSVEPEIERQQTKL